MRILDIFSNFSIFGLLCAFWEKKYRENKRRKGKNLKRRKSVLFGNGVERARESELGDIIENLEF